MLKLKEEQSIVITCRELTKKDELTSYFKLRYEEYLNSGFTLTTNRDCIDIEPFDFYAHFIGAFLTDANKKEQLVGGIRMVQKKQEGSVASIVREICNDSFDLKHLVKYSSPYPFQIMKSIRLDKFLNDWEKQGKNVVEFGKVVVKEEYRKSKIGIYLLNAIHYLGAITGAQVGIGYCPSRLRPFYEENGCQIIKEFYHPDHKWPALLLSINLTSFAKVTNSFEIIKPN